MLGRFWKSLLPKKRARLTLETRELRELGYYEYFFHKNCLFWVSGHVGREQVQVAAVGGMSPDEGYQLKHLYGNDLRFLPGAESVEHLVTDYR